MSNTINTYDKLTAIPLPTSIPVGNIGSLRSRLNERLLITNQVDAKFIFEFNILQETTLKEGNLVYVFKPFRNMKKAVTSIDTAGNEIQEGEIIDFSTNLLNFSINNPVDITVQPSYDGSVNLILNDNLNPPRLVNSRFSATEGKRYLVIDRSGNKDTNLYDELLVEKQTKLYKTINQIPEIQFEGIHYDGALPVGNYVFYFKLADADDNETDIVAESGIVSCFIGGINDPFTTRGGLLDENSGKSIVFNITNIDSSYNFLIVYYSRSTSGTSEQEQTTYHKINNKFTIQKKDSQYRITGYEPSTVITKEQINIQYNIIDRNASTAQAQNRLFLANTHKATFPFQDLQDLSFRIFPTPVQNDTVANSIGFLDTDYISTTKTLSGIDPTKCMYYNVNNIYNFTGYWDEEIYRFAIVYVLNDYSLTDPFNVRGRDFSINGGQYTRSGGTYDMYDGNISSTYPKGKRQYIYNEESGFCPLVPGIPDSLENLRGTVKIKIDATSSQIDDKKIKPIGIQFEISPEVQQELEIYTKGFFIVRQKRIPTIIAQGYTIGHDSISGLPLIPETSQSTVNHVIQGVTLFAAPYTDVNYGSYSGIAASMTAAETNYRLPSKGEIFFSFVHENLVSVVGSTNIFSSIKDRVKKGSALIVPDLILDSENLNSVFVGTEFNLTSTNFKASSPGFTRQINTFNFPQETSMEKLDQLATNFTIEGYNVNALYETKSAILVAVNEDTPAITFNDNYFSSRAGIPEEAWRFSAFLKEDFGLLSPDLSSYTYNGITYTKQQNVPVRGIFMSYVGLIPTNKSELSSGNFYNIRTLGYNEKSIRDYFKIRFNDTAPFTSVMNRMSWEMYNTQAINNTLEIYRGDCFINQTTIRVLRNFQDPTLPTNDVIIDPDTLTHFPGYKDLSGLILDDADGTEIAKIKRSDVNGVRLGYWVTLKFCSNINYAFRCIDTSYVSEYALFGRPRGFYPLYDKQLSGNNKLAESTLMNVGYNSTTSDKEYFVLPEVPAIKNDFSNRIMYSEIHVNDAFKNGYRIFQGIDYKDYTLEYGSITKIVAWLNNLIVIFESGVGVLPINERTMVGSSEGENLFLKGAGVLPEKPLMISQGIGSAWKDSIQLSQNYIYGVDTAAKKIWRTDGQKFDTFSDFRVQKFLHDNITFTVYDKIPTVGLKNVVTHFDVHKYDLLFTFYDQSQNNEDIVWNLCYNEHLNNWTTRFSWVPSFSANANNTMFTFARGTCKVTSMIAKSISGADGIGSIYIDTQQEAQLTLGDYLSLFYEIDLNQLLTPFTYTQVLLVNNVYTLIEKGKAISFLDNYPDQNHPMAQGDYSFGYDKTYVFDAPASCILVAYGLSNNKFLLSNNSKLYFYASDDINGDIADDILIATKVNNEDLDPYLTTFPTKKVLKVRFVVEGTSGAIEAERLSREGWSFNIMAVPISDNDIQLTNYLLTLEGKEKYKGETTFQYTFPNNADDKYYDNKLFRMNAPTNTKFSINPFTFKNYCAAEKYELLKAFLSKIYFALLIDLKVTFNTATSLNKIIGYDQLQDVLFVRPSKQVLEDLLDRFTNGPVPILKPETLSCPITYFTSAQETEIRDILSKTIELYNAHSTTNLWKHGTNKIFGNDTVSKPANWYGEQHPFEFEFIVNGDEIGIHKLFDNLKIISNKTEPNSFEFEIVGDSYEFTKDYQDGRSEAGHDFLNEIYLKDGYALVAPSTTTKYAKTSEHRILSIQSAQDIKKVGLRKGNMQYKEDMWEVQIAPLRIEKTNPITKTTEIVESKIRDKYCKIRVKYTGEQVAIITALNTLYTLSYS